MLLDTSGLLCIYDVRDHRHIAANNYFIKSPQMITTSYVLTEFVALAQARVVARKGALDFLWELQNLPHVEVTWVDESLHQQAMDLLAARLDKTYSLCDAVSFILMRERSINEALTTDKHFEQEGFLRLLAS